MSSRSVRGPFRFTTTKTVLSGNYTVVNESVVVVNKTAGAATTITLPASAAAGSPVREIMIVDGKGDSATNNVTVSPAGADTINGGSSVTLAVNYGSIMLRDVGGGAWITSVGTAGGAGVFTTLNASGAAALSGATTAVTGALTTTDGVASGTARKVGGAASVGVSTSDTITAATSANAFVSFAQTYALPPSTIKAGTVVRVRAMVDVINAAAGTATLTINLRLGGTSVIATTAIDQAANDFQTIEFMFVGRAAPGATAAVVGSGQWVTSTGGTNVTKGTILQSTNFATNGSLTIDCQAKWSAADATTTAQLELLVVEVIG